MTEYIVHLDSDSPNEEGCSVLDHLEDLGFSYQPNGDGYDVIVEVPDDWGIDNTDPDFCEYFGIDKFFVKFIEKYDGTSTKGM